MNNDLLSLLPQPLWQYFGQICDIPHPSKQEEKIINFVRTFGIDLKLETVVDKVGNVIIRKPATAGMENCKGVILQTHLDMVPQKNSDSPHNFDTDPILPYIDGEWLKARGTTLGADNGIGVAAALAILADNNISHGPIEALFTVDEETGMTGAFGLEKGLLNGDILINLDSEDEGELYVGCAGGVNTIATLPYKTEVSLKNSVAFLVSLKGLKGGHSGLDIILQRGNANKILNRFLYILLKKYNIRISEICGGNMRNAIPREAFAKFTVLKRFASKINLETENFVQIIKDELSSVESDFTFEVKEVEMPATVIDKAAATKMIRLVSACPHGVIRMSSEVEGLTETSTNLAIVEAKDGMFIFTNLLRSSVNSAKEYLQEVIENVFELAGAKVEHSGAYPGWKPNINSLILKTMQNVYQAMYGKIPEIKAVHAGLECGLFGGVYPNLDMISVGPTIRFPHSPDEKVNIPSVEKFWRFLVETLKNIPTK